MNFTHTAQICYSVQILTQQFSRTTTSSSFLLQTTKFFFFRVCVAKPFFKGYSFCKDCVTCTSLLKGGDELCRLNS